MATRWKYSTHCLFLFSQICYQTCRNHLQIDWILQQLPNTAEKTQLHEKVYEVITNPNPNWSVNRQQQDNRLRTQPCHVRIFPGLPTPAIRDDFYNISCLGKDACSESVYFDLFVAVALWVLSCRAMSALLRPVSFWLVLISPCSQLWSQSIRSLQRINIQQKTYLARYSHETSTYVLRRYCMDRMVLSDSTWVRLLLILKQLCVN